MQTKTYHDCGPYVTGSQIPCVLAYNLWTDEYTKQHGSYNDRKGKLCLSVSTSRLFGARVHTIETARYAVATLASSQEGGDWTTHTVRRSPEGCVQGGITFAFFALFALMPDAGNEHEEDQGGKQGGAAPVEPIHLVWFRWNHAVIGSLIGSDVWVLREHTGDRRVDRNRSIKQDRCRTRSILA